MEIKKVVKEGKVAVLVSKGWGAGFTTWTTNWNPEDKNCLQQLFDPTLVEMCKQLQSLKFFDRDRTGLLDQMLEYIQKTYPKAFVGGIEDLEVEWVPEGSLFRVNEYDGKEEVEYFEQTKWIKA